MALRTVFSQTFKSGPTLCLSPPSLGASKPRQANAASKADMGRLIFIGRLLPNFDTAPILGANPMPRVWPSRHQQSTVPHGRLANRLPEQGKDWPFLIVTR